MDFYGHFSRICLEARFSTVLFSRPTYDKSYIQQISPNKLYYNQIEYSLNFLILALKVTRSGHACFSTIFFSKWPRADWNQASFYNSFKLPLKFTYFMDRHAKFARDFVWECGWLIIIEIEMWRVFTSISFQKALVFEWNERFYFSVTLLIAFNNIFESSLKLLLIILNIFQWFNVWNHSWRSIN